MDTNPSVSSSVKSRSKNVLENQSYIGWKHSLILIAMVEKLNVTIA